MVGLRGSGYFDDYRLEHTIKELIFRSVLRTLAVFVLKKSFHGQRIRKVSARNIFRGKITTFFVEQSAM